MSGECATPLDAFFSQDRYTTPATDGCYTLTATSVADSHGGTASSPTGRNPRLLWTPQRQWVWNKMRAENHPFWQLIQSNADRSGTSNARYADVGNWAAFAYQITGDAAYAQKAMAQARSDWGTTDGNHRREFFQEYVQVLDWIYPGISVRDRADFVARVNQWGAEAAASHDSPYGPNDSDQSTADYFGLCWLKLATGDFNLEANRLFANAHVGGLDATAIDRSTMRNTIEYYVVHQAEGGTWIEGSQYNLGTLNLLLMGAEGVRTATGVDHFPSITAYVKKTALNFINEITPDYASMFEWGDVEQPRQLGPVTRRIHLAGMLAGLTQSDLSVGPYVHRMAKETWARFTDDEPTTRALIFYNPYAPAADWRGALSPGYWSPGQGILFLHEGWGAQDSLFAVHLPRKQLETDHEVRYFGDFRLYRRGEWALDRPQGYGGPTSEGEGVNAMLIAGLSSMWETKGAVAQEFGPGRSYAYVAGTTAGQYLSPQKGSYDLPEPFLHEWTRSIFFLPASDKRSDTLVVHDRVDAEDPRKKANFSGYAGEQDRIVSAPARKQWIIHSPVRPALAAGGFSWSTPKGQAVKVSVLLPASPRITPIDEDATWPDNYPYPDKSEQKWQTRVAPPTDRRWDTLLHVVQVSDAGVAVSASLVRSTGGEAEGALVKRAGLADALVLFGAQPSGRVLASSYTVQWTASGATDVYLVDLSAAKRWTASVDGAAAAPLAVSGQGVAMLAVAGAGAHSLAITAR
ncbi:hypothetical protein [Sorangium sp. So ce1099]|uniref:hypothetical protein n=1 Tax=Sorangium sp. So ce1099 TaxID=3133331 RepID=UPI003F5FBDE6